MLHNFVTFYFINLSLPSEIRSSMQEEKNLSDNNE